MATHLHATSDSTFNRRLLVGLMLLCFLSVSPVQAQVAKVWAPDQATTGQQTNAFFSWTGSQHVNGLWLEVPDGWTVRAVAAIEPHRMLRIPLTVRRSGRAFKAEAPSSLHGPYTFMVQFETGTSPGRYAWRAVPYATVRTPTRTREQRLESHRIERRVQLNPWLEVKDNHVLALNPEAVPLQIRHAALPPLDPQQPFTVEFWMQTTGLEQVALSTWDGTPQQGYPFEFVIDARGHLLCYRGAPGRHESLATPRPVADGTWQHIALVSNQTSLRLLLNGVTVDSLTSALAASFNTSPVTLGGRPGTAQDATLRFEGLMDEVRIWNQTRTDREVQQAMHVPMKSDPASRLTLSFEETLPGPLLHTPEGGWTRARSDLAFQYPIRRLRAIPQQGTVGIEWHLPAPQAQTMELERSYDGQTYTPIFTRTLTAAEAQRLDEDALFTFYDHQAFGGAGVCFYRIQQRFEDGNALTSKTVKVGMGTEELPASAQLLGNWPNPFQTSTLIRYELQEAQHVHISVWSISGHQIQTLVSARRDPGLHEVRFDAGGLPSGTYFVHLKSTQGEQTLKMLVTK